MYFLHVVDTLPPAITGCPGIDTPPISVTIELGTPTAVVDFSAPSASDLSGDVAVSSDCQSGDNYPVGVTDCLFIFSDSSGNSATCPFTIEVLTGIGLFDFLKHSISFPMHDDMIMEKPQ